MCDVIVDDPKKFYTNKNKNQTQRNKLLYEYNKTLYYTPILWVVLFYILGLMVIVLTVKSNIENII